MRTFKIVLVLAVTSVTLGTFVVFVEQTVEPKFLHVRHARCSQPGKAAKKDRKTAVARIWRHSKPREHGWCPSGERRAGGNCRGRCTHSGQESRSIEASSQGRQTGAKAARHGDGCAPRQQNRRHLGHTSTV
jgi:hypothetical protein